MIAPQELRIGNLVYIPETGQILPITAINTDLGVWVNRSLGVLGFDQIEPIELTEEWMLRFGFQKVSNIRYAKEGFVPFITKGNAGYYASYVNYTLFSVHQLQNLVHSVTGEELQLKN